MVSPSKEELIEALESWFKKQPPGLVDFVRQDTEYESVFQFLPKHHNSSFVEFRIGNEGSFGLYFGKGFAFEDITFDTNFVLDVLDSVKAARIQESIWKFGGKIVRSQGKLILGTGEEITDQGSNSIFGLFRLGRKTDIEYEKW